MMNKRTWILGLSILLTAGCTSRWVEPGQDKQIENLHGSTAVVSLSGDALRPVIRIPEVEVGGTFVRLHLPANLHVAAETWTGDNGTLHLVAALDGAIDLGIVALPEYSGDPVSVELSLAPGKSVSRPPTGTSNQITDLSVNAAGAGQVTLGWTQRNTGDYDFNGEVNIADLTPLGKYFGQTVSRNGPGADQVAQFWIDGDENGEINIADLTPIGQSYTASVAGYNIRLNGAVLNNAQGQLPTVAASEAIIHAGLPPTYLVSRSGSTGDTWVVTSVDSAGAEGADSAGGTGPVDLYANLNISGADLFDLIGGGSGPFGPGKFGSRVIDPIDIVQNAPLGTTTLIGTQAKTSGLPRGKTLLARVQFAPVVNLATGAPKGGASLKGSSDVSDGDSEFLSVPFKLPVGTDPVNMSMDIGMDPAPAGGYFVTLRATLDVYGDNPDTLPVETQYVKIYKNRLEYATGKVSRDTDGDDIFDGEEAEYDDSDRDCISEMEVENEEDWDELEDDDRFEIEFEGVLSSIDFTVGTAHFTNVTLDSDGTPYPDTTVRLSEATEYESKLQGDLPDVSVLVEGSPVDFDVYEIIPDIGPPYYWCEKIRLRDD